MLLVIFLAVGGAFALPTNDSGPEVDGESSRKVLGSSVVTSVSVIMDTGNGTKAVYTDAVGKPVPKPTMASQLASPINLLNPDRYEFYTFDDSGDLVKRLMTLDEIQGIIASGDGDGMNYQQSPDGEPENKVNDIVSNVQNVLKEEIESHKNSDTPPPYDTPDVSSTWSMILPAIFGNTGETIRPERPLPVVTPDTIMLEPNDLTTKSSVKKETTTEEDNMETVVLITKKPKPETSTESEKSETIIILTRKPEMPSTVKTQQLQAESREPTPTEKVTTQERPLRTSPQTQKPTTMTVQQTQKPTTTEYKPSTYTTKQKPVGFHKKTTTEKPTTQPQLLTVFTREPTILTQRPTSLHQKLSTFSRKPVTQTMRPTTLPPQKPVTQQRPAAYTQKPYFVYKTSPSTQQTEPTVTTDLEKSESMILLSSTPSNSSSSVFSSTQKVDAPTISIEITSDTTQNNQEDYSEGNFKDASHSTKVAEEKTTQTQKLTTPSKLSEMFNTQKMPSEASTFDYLATKKPTVLSEFTQNTSPSTPKAPVFTDTTQKETQTIEFRKTTPPGNTLKTTNIDDISKITQPQNTYQSTFADNTSVDDKKITPSIADFSSIATTLMSDSKKKDTTKTTSLKDAQKTTVKDYTKTTVPYSIYTLKGDPQRPTPAKTTQKTTTAVITQETIPIENIRKTTLMDTTQRTSGNPTANTRRPTTTSTETTRFTLLDDIQKSTTINNAQKITADIYKTTQLENSQNTTHFDTLEQQTAEASSEFIVQMSQKTTISSTTQSPVSNQNTTNVNEDSLQQTKLTDESNSSVTYKNNEKTTEILSTRNVPTTEPSVVTVKLTRPADLIDNPSSLNTKSETRPSNLKLTTITSTAPSVTTYKPTTHYKSTTKVSSHRRTTKIPSTTVTSKTESLPTLWELISTKKNPSSELQDLNTPSSTYPPLSTFFWIHDAKTTTRNVPDTTRTTSKPEEATTESYKVKEPISSTEISSKLKLPAENTNEGMNSDEIAEYMDKLPVTDLLDQLLLSTTNIYEINTQLLENDTLSNSSSTTTKDEMSTINASENTKTEQTTTDKMKIEPETFIIKVTDIKEDVTSTTERNLMESIEKILSQAIGPVEPPAKDMKEAEEKVYEIISSSNQKLMEKVQSEAATVASHLMDHKNEDKILNESVSSLMSQILNSSVSNATTTTTTTTNTTTTTTTEKVKDVTTKVMMNKVTEPALSREDVEIFTQAATTKEIETEGTTLTTTTLSDGREEPLLESKEADDIDADDIETDEHIRIIVTEPVLGSTTELQQKTETENFRPEPESTENFSLRDDDASSEFEKYSSASLETETETHSAFTEFSTAIPTESTKQYNTDTTKMSDSEFAETVKFNTDSNANTETTKTLNTESTGPTETTKPYINTELSKLAETTKINTESTKFEPEITFHVETTKIMATGSTKQFEITTESFNTDSSKSETEGTTESLLKLELKALGYEDSADLTETIPASTQTTVANNEESFSSEHLIKITTQAPDRNNFSNIFANYKFVTESSFVDQNYLNLNDTHNKTFASLQHAATNMKSENDTKNNWKLISTMAPPPEKEQSKPLPRPADLVQQQPESYGLEDSRAKLDTDINRFIDLCNELSFGFWNSVTTGISTSRSVFVSPFAAISLLAMVFLGARGATSGEMNDILRLDDMVTFNPHLIFRNVSESIEVSKKAGVAASAIIRELYSDRGKGKLLPFYKERARQFYDGHVEEVSFKEIGDVIRRRTNLLVKRYTWGKISEYIKDNTITVRPPLAGVSVSIFQTDCSAASTEGRDGELHFMVSPSLRHRRLVPVPAAVWRNNFLAGYDPNLDATAVSIGMKDETVSAIFVMPGQQGISAPGDGLARLERHLVENSFLHGTWSQLLRSLIPRTGLEVQIPRFSHKSVLNATVALQRMGLKDLFSSDKADLRGLNGIAHELHLSDMVQINNFAMCGENRIDETHHSEIYPASSNRSARKLHNVQGDDVLEEPRDYQRAFHDPLHDPKLLSLPLPLRPRQARLPDVPRLRFDRPFLYFVRHNPTGLILHMGRFNPRLLP